MSWCVGQEFVSSSANHENRKHQIYDPSGGHHSVLANRWATMSDDEFEKLSSANSKFELTKEEKK